LKKYIKSASIKDVISTKTKQSRHRH